MEAYRRKDGGGLRRSIVEYSGASGR